MNAPFNLPGGNPSVTPSPAMIAAYLEHVFGGTEGFIPARGYPESDGSDEKNVLDWFGNDASAPGRLTDFARKVADKRFSCFIVPGTVAERGQALAVHVLKMRAVLVDLDKGDIGAKRAWLEQHLGPATMVVRSGGVTPDGQAKLHLYWRLDKVADPRRVADLRGVIARKVDGDRSFGSAHQPIRVAGSIHGKRAPRLVEIIHIDQNRTLDLFAMEEAAHQMAPLPGLPPVASKADRHEYPPVAVTGEVTDAHRRHARGKLEKLAGEFRSAGEGDRHATMMRVSCMLGGIVAMGWLPSEEVENCLDDVVVAIHEANRHQGAFKSLREGIAKGMATPGGPLEHDFRTSSPTALMSSLQAAGHSVTGATTFDPATEPQTFAHFMARKQISDATQPQPLMAPETLEGRRARLAAINYSGEAAERLFVGTLPRIGSGVIAGPGYSGKSLVALDAAMAIIANRPWAGCEPGRIAETDDVLIVAFEGEGDVKRRIFAAARRAGIDKDDPRLRRIHMVMPAQGDAGLHELLNELEHQRQAGGRYALVVVDTWNQSGFVENNDSNDEVGAAYGKINTFAREYQTCMLVVDHIAKNGDTLSPRGASAKRDDTDFTVHVTLAGNGAMLKWTKVRGLSCPNEIAFEIVADAEDRTAGVVVWKATATVARTSGGSVRKEALAAIVANGPCVTDDPEALRGSNATTIGSEVKQALFAMKAASADVIDKAAKAGDLAISMGALIERVMAVIGASNDASDPRKKARTKIAELKTFGWVTTSEKGAVAILHGPQWRKPEGMQATTFTVHVGD